MIQICDKKQSKAAKNIQYKTDCKILGQLQTKPKKQHNEIHIFLTLIFHTKYPSFHIRKKYYKQNISSDSFFVIQEKVNKYPSKMSKQKNIERRANSMLLNTQAAK